MNKHNTKQGETTNESGSQTNPKLADLEAVKRHVGQSLRMEFAGQAFTDEQRNKIMDDVVSEFYLDTITDFVAHKVEKNTLAAFGNKRWWIDRVASAAIQTVFMGAAVGGAYAVHQYSQKPLFGKKTEGLANSSPFSRIDAAPSTPRSLRGTRRESQSNLESSQSAA